MSTSANDRERVYRSIPGDRRHIVEETGVPSYAVPVLLRWLKRRGLAHNNQKGYWEPVPLPVGVDVCWEHGMFHIGACPACKNRRATLVNAS